MSKVFILQIPKSDLQGNCHIGYNFETNEFFFSRERFDRLSTEEEKELLFKAIKDNGYKWNAETKTLEKLVEPKFKVGDKIANRLCKYMWTDGSQGIISKITDNKYIFTDGSYISTSNQDNWELVHDKKHKFNPKTLHPFDKVLARFFDSDCWRCEFFSHITNVYDNVYRYTTTSGNTLYDKCIPYNDETKHLV